MACTAPSSGLLRRQLRHMVLFIAFNEHPNDFHERCEGMSLLFADFVDEDIQERDQPLICLGCMGNVNHHSRLRLYRSATGQLVPHYLLSGRCIRVLGQAGVLKA